MPDPIPQPPGDDFEGLVANAERLTRKLDQNPNAAVREDVFALLEAIDGIHRGAILRLVELMIGTGNHDLIHVASEDPMIAALFQLYGVLPLPELVRWHEALDSVRTDLKRRSADVELIRLNDNMPSLRLTGGFTEEESQLRQLVQNAIASMFGAYQSVRWEPREAPPVPSRLVPISAIQPARSLQWFDLIPESELPLGEIRKVARKDVDIAICRWDAGHSAFPNACPGTALPLHLGRLSAGALICPWHSCAFDLATGKRLAGVGSDLKPLTLRLRGGMIQLRAWE